MRIDDFFWLAAIVEKLAIKHGVETWEVEETFRNSPRFRFRQRGNQEGEDLYAATGQTDASRHLIVLFIHKPPRENQVVQPGTDRQCPRHDRQGAETA